MRMSDFLTRRMMSYRQQGEYAVNWNQFASDVWKGGTSFHTLTIDADGTYRYTATSNNPGVHIYFNNDYQVNNIQNHKYYAKIRCLSSLSQSSVRIRLALLASISWGEIASNTWTDVVGIYHHTESDVASGFTLGFMRMNVVVDEYVLIKYGNVCDLTQMFGAGNEPSTAEEFESWLQENGINPNAYIPYNAGQTRYMTKPSWIVD